MHSQFRNTAITGLLALALILPSQTVLADTASGTVSTTIKVETEAIEGPQETELVEETEILETEKATEEIPETDITEGTEKETEGAETIPETEPESETEPVTENEAETEEEIAPVPEDQTEAATETLPESEVETEQEAESEAESEKGAEEKGNVYYSSADLNIRDNPDGNVIGQYKKGDRLIVLEERDGWSRTDKGWVFSDYLTKNPSGEISKKEIKEKGEKKKEDTFQEKVKNLTGEYNSAEIKTRSNSLFVASSAESLGSGFYWKTHIVVKDPEKQVHAGLSNDDWGGAQERTTSFAARKGAVVATNASQFWYEDGTTYAGVTFSNGSVIQGSVTNGTEVCLMEDGTLFTPGGGITAQTLAEAGVKDSWAAADPVLISDGQLLSIPASQLSGAYPRTAIGMVEPGEYYIVTAGSSGYNGGLTYQELQGIFNRLGCVFARPLDGGGSATLVINRKLVNTPATGKERPVADFFYVTK